MKSTIKKEEKYTILTVEEEKLDSSISPDMKSEFTQLSSDGTKNLIVDLTNVKYSDSSGLSALLVGNRVFNESGGVFVLAGVSDHVMKLLKISMLDKVLEIMPTLAEAIDAVLLHEVESELKQDGEE